MTRIRVLPHPKYCPNGADFEAPEGSNLCQELLDHQVNIEHACDMSAACTTCHVLVREGFDQLNEMDDIEADLLDRAWGLEPDSRLSCQVKVSGAELEVELPRYTINHAAER